jgi:tRNA U34 5-methylaminomethyl-2-thiouridine-forming methyltransferase MnmC
MEQEIILTADGSKTLFVPGLNEHYHSKFGAVQESIHVFIMHGLQEIKIEQPQILEIGFGTGLNALLTIISSNPSQIINYDAVEPYPLNWDVVNQLDYQGFLKLSEEQRKMFETIHAQAWNSTSYVHPSFILNKINCSIQSFKPDSNYDLVYYDAFAPEIQPELWEEPVFLKIYNAMNVNGILVTYCAKGEVRRIMQRCGFEVERLPGPPGKREMLRAVKK